MDTIYYIKNRENGLYIGLNNKTNDVFNTMDIVLTDEPCQWVFNGKDKIIKHTQTGGYIVQKYRGWMPDTSNILLLNKNSYDICLKPLLWEYADFFLSTEVYGIQYNLCVNSDNNIILKRSNLKLPVLQNWELIQKKI
tara:strand:- start:536 stop:949 length:414 start_codon:yes stop_codon:yes gene_type:complete